MEDAKKKQEEIFFLFLNLDMILKKIHFLEEFLYTWQSE